MKGTIDGIPFEFDADSVRVDEAEAVERAMGMSFQKWGEQLGTGSVGAMRAMLWIVRRRDNPGLRFDDPSLGAIRLSSILIDDEEPATPKEQDGTEPSPT